MARPDLLAAVDLGSNSFHLQVGRVVGGQIYPLDTLRELYGAKGALDGDDIVAYCRIGERSAHTWFVLHELLGQDNVRNYDGSWTEWGNMVAVPVEKDV